jgi:hypothetical protein
LSLLEIKVQNILFGVILTEIERTKKIPDKESRSFSVLSDDIDDSPQENN